MQGSASKKFWATPELVEMLFPHLDASSILELGKAHPPAIEILQGGLCWDKLIQRTCPDNTSTHYSDSLILREKKAEIVPLIKLLALMEESQDYLVSLLDLICTRFPINQRRQYRVWQVGGVVSRPEGVEVTTSSNNTSFKISSLGFLLLEEVEGTFGSSEQSVQWVGLRNLEGDMLFSLRSRVLRQPGVMIKMEVTDIICSNLQEAEDLLLLLQNCKRLTGPPYWFYMLSIRGEPSAEAWAALVKAVKQLPGVLDISDTGRAQCGISATRTTLLSAGRGDLKVIWEAVRGADVMYSAGGLYGGRVYIEEDEGWELACG